MSEGAVAGRMCTLWRRLRNDRNTEAVKELVDGLMSTLVDCKRWLSLAFGQGQRKCLFDIGAWVSHFRGSQL